MQLPPSAAANHSIDQQTVNAAFAAIRALFDLPLEAKMALLADVNNRGYTPFAEETLDPANQSSGDTKGGVVEGCGKLKYGTHSACWCESVGAAYRIRQWRVWAQWLGACMTSGAFASGGDRQGWPHNRSQYTSHNAHIPHPATHTLPTPPLPPSRGLLHRA